MSRLLMDVGNTRLKWALHTPQGLTAHGSLPQATLTAAQLRQTLLNLDVMRHGAITEVLVANVAGESWRERLTAVMQDGFAVMPRFVTATAERHIGSICLRNAYREPHKLGVDRWLAMQAAIQRLPNQHLLVVSVGTALTVDALDASGQHLGGLIVPGAALMVRSLMQGTSDIAAHADAEVLQADHWLGDNTRSCVELGAQHALSAVVVEAYARMHAAQRPARVILTGGGAHALSLPADLQSQSVLVNDLVLEGLALN